MCVCLYLCVCVSLETHYYELKNKLRKSVWGVTLSLRIQCERVNVVANFELDCATNATTQTSGNFYATRQKRIILRLRQGLRSKLIANSFMQRAPGQIQR